ncbi:MAG: biotin/lipoyl-containing protein [Candidatus Cryptobacteroides sp.]|nr:biotin/lipoyl-containing protein [Candidatus Cryptobacteroides sp.]
MAEYRYRINGHTYNIEIGAENGGTIEVNVNGKVYTVERQEISTTADMAPKSIPDQNSASLHKDTARPASTPNVQATPVQATAPSALDANTAAVTAPLPGTIISIKVKPGDKVTANQTVAVLEAMKMENEIEAGYAGTVSEVKVAERDTVLEGAVLITISN